MEDMRNKELEAGLSRELGPMRDRVQALIQSFARLWREAPARPPRPSRLYPPAEKRRIERDLTGLIDRILSRKDRFSEEDETGRAAFMEELADGVRGFSKTILDRVDLPLPAVYDRRFVESTRLFLKAARDFDPDIGIASVYQALRNVWIMNTLQFAFGIEIQHTPPVFAYSMVYPYLDNLIDDDDIPRADKLDLLIEVREWLEGAGAQPRSPRGEKLRSLIEKIEDALPRETYPGVYRSMLAIYNGQIRSLFQQRGSTTPSAEDILEISLDKGGTSVLADGYLVAGRLTPRQEEFCFGFGAFLQMADDLQDIHEDRRQGHITLFSRNAGRIFLDALVYKLMYFMSACLDGTLDSSRSEDRALKNLIGRACTLMYMESAGKNDRFFSPDCLRNFQAAFPVRFSYLRKLRRRLDKKAITGKEKISDLDPVTTALLTLSSRALALE